MECIIFPYPRTKTVYIQAIRTLNRFSVCTESDQRPILGIPGIYSMPAQFLWTIKGIPHISKDMVLHRPASLGTSPTLLTKVIRSEHQRDVFAMPGPSPCQWVELWEYTGVLVAIRWDGDIVTL